MIKVPAKFKKNIANELKRFQAHVQTLASRGKSATEEDARILINDILSYVLGYDKYNDLKTEYKEKNDRIDYVIKLSEGPNARKKDKFDFIIEAKSTAVELKQDHINQTLSYCLNMSVDYFILTNAKDWKLFKVINTKAKKEADLIWEYNISQGTDYDTMAEEMYTISKQAYTDRAWEQVSDISKATDVGEIMALIYSDKFVRQVCRSLKELHEVKVSEAKIQEILADEIFKDFAKMNKTLLRKLNAPNERTNKEPSESPTQSAPPLEQDEEKSSSCSSDKVA